jgi:hypothetical protein
MMFKIAKKIIRPIIYSGRRVKFAVVSSRDSV